MGWGAAFRACVLPSLLIGPMLGVAGALIILTVGVFVDGARGMDVMIGAIFVIVGAILGLAIASPLCLIFGTLLLYLTGRDPRFGGFWVWLVSGGVGGFVCGLAIGSTTGEGEVMALIALLFGALGMAGATVGRRKLLPTIARLDQLRVEDLFS